MDNNLECKHNPVVRIDSGYIITYCSKCGKILDSHLIETETNKNKDDSEKTTIILLE